jgi:hypothetical protein
VAELVSLVLTLGPLRFDACLQWGCDDDEAAPMPMAPPELIDVPEIDDDGLGFRA